MLRVAVLEIDGYADAIIAASPDNPSASRHQHMHSPKCCDDRLNPQAEADVVGFSLRPASNRVRYAGTRLRLGGSKVSAEGTWPATVRSDHAGAVALLVRLI